MPGPLSKPHGHHPSGAVVAGKSAMGRAAVKSCRNLDCPSVRTTRTPVERATLTREEGDA